MYQTAARTWLTLAGCSLLLSPSARLVYWLPLHLTLAGAVSLAIAGAMQNFAAALTSTGSPPERWVWTQFATMNAGVALIALGRPLALPAVVAVGGASFVTGAVILLAIVRRAVRRSLHERHRLPVWMYSAAVGFVIIGAALGALMGSGVIHDAGAEIALIHAHMTINVLGWVSLTIVATLITLLPSILRVKLPRWHGTATAALLVTGPALLASGLAFDRTVVVALGGLCELAGALGAAWMVSKVMRTPRRWAIPVSALHLLAGFCWFLIGSMALAMSATHGVVGFDAFVLDFLTMFVGGWMVQVLLGAWSFLLPMGRPGHPDERRIGLGAIEFAAWIQLALLNAGVALMSLRAAGWVGPPAGSVGVRLALIGAGIALVKAWAFPMLGTMGLADRRGEAVWGRARLPQTDRD